MNDRYACRVTFSLASFLLYELRDVVSLSE